MLKLRTNLLLRMEIFNFQRWNIHNCSLNLFSQTPVFSTSALLLRGVSEILPTPPATPRADTQAVSASFDYQFNLPTSTPLNPITSLPQLTDSIIGDFFATPSELTMNAITSTQFHFQPAPESNPVLLSEVQRKRKGPCENEEGKHNKSLELYLTNIYLLSFFKID